MEQKEKETGSLKRIQRVLLAEREKFSLFLSLNTNCFFEYEETSGMIAFAKNEIFSKLSGLVIELSEGSFLKKGVIYPEDFLNFCEMLQDFKDAEKEFRFYGEDGSFIWGLVKTAITTDVDGTRILIGCINDNSNNHRRLEAKRKKEQCDSLTEIYNRIYIKEVIQKYLQGEGKDLNHAFVLLDIDDLKDINNKFGRIFGDTVLINLVRGLRRILPEDTIMGRVGGDKFVLFFPTTEGEIKVRERIETIQNEIKRVYAGENEEEYLTGSVGAVCYSLDGSTFDELFKKADFCLFQAKKRGKGFFELFNKEKIQQLDESVDYYNQYKLKLNTDNKQDEQYRNGHEIVNYAQNLMSSAKDIQSGIKILIEKIGKEYNVSSVIVLEKIKDRKKLCETYRWNEKSKKDNKEEIKLDYKSFLKAKNLYSQDGLCIIHDMEEFQKEDENGKILEPFHTKSMMQCVFYEEGQFKGMICIKDDEHQREWSNYEIETFLSLTRILSFYQFRLRVSEKIQERLEQIKNYDTLTGLPTFYKFKEDAKRKIEKDPGNYAVVYCDIGNFKFINDLYEYKTGDEVLKDFAFSIERFLPEDTLVGRVSADNFVALTSFTSESNLEEKIVHFSKEFHNLMKERYMGINLTVITGICILPKEDKDIFTGIDNANMARKSIKGSSIGACRFYDKTMAEEIKREQEIVSGMEEALDNKEFIVYLQPKVSLQEEMLVGAEALVRWKRKDGTLIPPDEFIPVFERNRFIIKLDFYVYEETFKVIQWWMSQKMEVIPISVNVSRVHLLEENFVNQLKDLVERYFIPPHYIELELTESAFISDTKATINVMRELRQYGFKVSIDDFGAGYSSLTLLKDMATDIIKLDKEFFANDVMKEEEMIIVSSIIGMAKKLHMKVISEGIETKIQADFLKDIKCDMVQGYYYAKPMPIADFEELMKKSKNHLAKGK